MSPTLILVTLSNRNLAALDRQRPISLSPAGWDHGGVWPLERPAIQSCSWSWWSGSIEPLQGRRPASRRPLVGVVAAPGKPRTPLCTNLTELLPMVAIVELVWAECGAA